jgi:hypothetical protein
MAGVKGRSGRKPDPKPVGRVAIIALVPPVVRDRLDREARKRGQSRSRVIEAAVRHYVGPA